LSKTDSKLVVEYDLKVTECPCGSKKKPEKCCGPVKDRTYSAEMDSVNYYKSDGFAIGLDFQLKRIVNGKLVPLIGEVQYTQRYKRAKGEKVIVQGLASSDYVMSPESVLHNYDAIYFVDTNTKSTSEHQISITAVLHAYIEHVEIDKYELKYLPLTILEFWDSEIEPETLGWYAVIRAIIEIPENKNKKIALVVDSRLDDLKALNYGNMPLFGEFYIPKNISLIYASVDVASNIANKLIKLSDKLATNKLNEVLANPRNEQLYETEYPCRYFRQWVH